MIKPEQLRKVAEYMGYRIKPTDPIFPYIYLETSNPNELYCYNPLESAEQDRELEVKFNISTTQVRRDKYLAFIGSKAWNVIIGEGDTPSEARLNAAIAYVEGLEG